METRKKTNLSWDEITRLPNFTICSVQESSSSALRFGILVQQLYTANGMMLLHTGEIDKYVSVTLRPKMAQEGGEPPLNVLLRAINQARAEKPNVLTMCATWCLSDRQGEPLRDSDFSTFTVHYYPSELGLYEPPPPRRINLASRNNILQRYQEIVAIGSDFTVTSNAVELFQFQFVANDSSTDQRRNLQFEFIKGFSYCCGTAELYLNHFNGFERLLLKNTLQHLHRNLLTSSKTIEDLNRLMAPIFFMRWLLDAFIATKKSMFVGVIAGKQSEMEFVKMMIEHCDVSVSPIVHNVNSGNTLQSIVFLHPNVLASLEAYIEKYRESILNLINEINASKPTSAPRASSNATANPQIIASAVDLPF